MASDRGLGHAPRHTIQIIVLLATSLAWKVAYAADMIPISCTMKSEKSNQSIGTETRSVTSVYYYEISTSQIVEGADIHQNILNILITNNTITWKESEFLKAGAAYYNYKIDRSTGAFLMNENDMTGKGASIGSRQVDGTCQKAPPSAQYILGP